MSDRKADVACGNLQRVVEARIRYLRKRCVGECTRKRCRFQVSRSCGHMLWVAGKQLYKRRKEEGKGRKRRRGDGVRKVPRTNGGACT